MNILKQDIKEYTVSQSMMVEHSVIMNLSSMFSYSCEDGSLVKEAKTRPEPCSSIIDLN